jgi:hypothetical protein
MKVFDVKNLIFILGLLFLISCSLERKIASEYIEKPTKGAVLLINPDFVYKEYLSKYLIINEKLSLKPEFSDSLFANFDTIDKYHQDSILIANKLYLDYFNNELFVDSCMYYLKKELTAYGFNVFDYDSVSSFMKVKDTSFVIKLAQLGLEQDIVYSPDAIIDMGDREKDLKIKVNAITTNAWFELERTNVKGESFPLLYTSNILTENINLRIVDRMALYKILTISKLELDLLPQKLAEIYASRIYDYLMNLYIMDKLPANKPPVNYYHYNKRILMIVPAGQHFIEMDKTN